MVFYYLNIQMIIAGLDCSTTSTGCVKFILDDKFNIIDKKKLGFKEIWISKFVKGDLPTNKKIQIKKASNILEVIRHCLL